MKPYRHSRRYYCSFRLPTLQHDGGHDLNPYKGSVKDLLPKEASVVGQVQMDTSQSADFAGAKDAVKANYTMQAGSISLPVQLTVANFDSSQDAAAAVEAFANKHNLSLESKNKSGTRDSELPGTTERQLCGRTAHYNASPVRMSLRPLPILRRLCLSSCGRVCDRFGSGAKSMKQFQIFVSIPPEEVVRRVASAIDKPGLGLAVPFGGKDFFGRINGLAFQFRNRRRFSSNNFAPGCFGNIQPTGHGSTINVQIAAKNTLF